MTASDLAAKLLREVEGCTLYAYPDPYSLLGRSFPANKYGWGKRSAIEILDKLKAKGVDVERLSGSPWTVGYGETGRHVGPATTWTQSIAETHLSARIEDLYLLIKSVVTRPLSQGQMAALISFLYNVGPGRANVKSGLFVLKNGKPSTLITKVKTGDFSGAALEFEKWVLAQGAESNGLKIRRSKERQLFETGNWVR